MALFFTLPFSVFFIVYDLLPISHPKYFVPELCLEFTEWMKTVVKSDMAICISNDVANKLRMWIEENSISTSVDFKITL